MTTGVQPLDSIIALHRAPLFRNTMRCARSNKPQCKRPRIPPPPGSRSLDFAARAYCTTPAGQDRLLKKFTPCQSCGRPKQNEPVLFEEWCGLVTCLSPPRNQNSACRREIGERYPEISIQRIMRLHCGTSRSLTVRIIPV